MALFLLIRHGENNYVKQGRLAGRLPGIHLNKKGYEQANLLASKLHGAPIKSVYSSPLERALETASPIASDLGLDVIIRAGLIETDYGEWQNQRIKGLSRQKLWKLVQSSPCLMRFPGGESFFEAQLRIVNELVELSKLHDPKDMVVCVSHADPIKLAVAYFIGLPIDMFQRLVLSPASITALLVNESSSRLLSMNLDVNISFMPD